MTRLLLSTLLGLSLSGCTIYRSEGRKQFESEAPGKVSATAAFQLKSCKKEGRLEAWFNEEFPSETYELVVAEPDLEIWRTHRDQSVVVKAIQKTSSTTLSCTYEFVDDTAWNLYKNDFVQELENNVMNLE